MLICTQAVVGVAGGSTRAALTAHQARRNNMADVSAKDGSQVCHRRTLLCNSCQRCVCVVCVCVFHVNSVLALDLEGVHDVKLHHPSSSVATSNQ